MSKPKAKDVIDRLIPMQEDLMKTNNKDLLGNDDTMAAWGYLTDYVKEKKKDQLQSGFEYLENVIHREYRLPPKKLEVERKKYASGRAFILSTVVPKQTEEPRKLPATKQTRAVQKPASNSKGNTTKSQNDQAPITSMEINHVQGPRPNSAIGRGNNTKRTAGQADRSTSSGEISHEQVRPSTSHERYQDNDRDRTHHLQQKIDKMKRELKETETKLRQTEMDKEYWVDRMSKVTGDMLTRDNPDIADLSDPKRPHKLGEKYSQLYDDEWTDAMEKLTETKDNERRGIDILLNILLQSHETCIKLADEQMKTLQKAVILEPSKEQNGVVNCPIDVQRSLKDAQKQASLGSLQAVHEYVHKQLTSLKDTFGDFPLDKLTSFVGKCTEICWGMVMQSPRMDFLFPEKTKGSRFNKDKFKEFTRSGDKLDFIVWPAMVIQKQGSLLVKGTVQPIAKQK